MVRVGVVVVMAVLTLMPEAAAATSDCGCGDIDLERSFAEADAVFVGEAVEVRNAPAGSPAEHERRYLFDVTGVYKGDVFAEQSIVSPVEERRCGLPWEQEGAIALVFGYADGSAHGGIETMTPGELAATTCDTGAFRAALVPASFPEPSPPLPGASPVGIDPPPLAPGGAAHFSWAWVALGSLATAGIVIGAWPRRDSGMT